MDRIRTARLTNTNTNNNNNDNDNNINANINVNNDGVFSGDRIAENIIKKWTINNNNNNNNNVYIEPSQQPTF